MAAPDRSAPTTMNGLRTLNRSDRKPTRITATTLAPQAQSNRPLAFLVVSPKTTDR